MLNLEKYKNEILNFTKQGIPIACVKGEILSCYDANCKECSFYKIQEIKNCSANQANWMYEEYVPFKTLTKREKSFCETVGEGWLARDFDGKLFFYSEKPKKIRGYWRIGPTDTVVFINNIIFPNFNFIKFEDSVPYSIKEMLAWDVVNDKI